MNTNIAIIDLGTNTFHLLVSEFDPQTQTFETLHRRRAYVRLADDGIHHIGNNAWIRAIETMKQFAEDLKKFPNTRLYALATEGLRRASNSTEFINAVYQQTGIPIQCISGEQEALFIYLGINNELPKQIQEPFLLLDIGGGSAEFIIANRNKAIWKQSFPMGAAVLKNGFFETDLPTTQQKERLIEHIDQTLMPFYKAFEQYRPAVLIGSSGTFDTIEEIFDPHTPLTHKPNITKVDISYMHTITQQLAQMTLNQRLNIQGMNPKRADLIVAPLLMVSYLLKKINIQHLYRSSVAIKEGIRWCAIYQPELLDFKK